MRAKSKLEFNSIPGSERKQKRLPTKKLSMKGASGKDPFEVY